MIILLEFPGEMREGRITEVKETVLNKRKISRVLFKLRMCFPSVFKYCYLSWASDTERNDPKALALSLSFELHYHFT